MGPVLFVKGEWSLTSLMEGKDGLEEALLTSVTTLICYSTLCVCLSVWYVLPSVLPFEGGSLHGM